MKGACVVLNRDLPYAASRSPAGNPAERLFRDLILRHVEHVRSEHAPGRISVQTAGGLWEHLTHPNVIDVVVERLLVLCPDAVQSGERRYVRVRLDDLLLLVSLVPVSTSLHMRSYFAPEGYWAFTQRTSLECERIDGDTWLAHWTVGIEFDRAEGALRAEAHLTVVPSMQQRQTGAMTLFAQDLFEPHAWDEMIAESREPELRNSDHAQADVSAALAPWFRRFRNSPDTWSDLRDELRSRATDISHNDVAGVGDAIAAQCVDHSETGYQQWATVYWSLSGTHRAAHQLRSEVGMRCLRQIASDAPPGWCTESALDIVGELLANAERLSPQELIELRLRQGGLLLHRQTGDHACNMRTAEAAFLEVTHAVDRRRDPMLWALAKNGLGLVFRERSQMGDADAATSGQACFRSVLESRETSSLPEFVAATQVNLAGLLVSHPGSDRQGAFAEAQFLCEQALQVQSRNAHPLEWSSIQHLLGILALRQTQSDQDESIERALQHLKLAAECPERRFEPRLMARTLNSLGNAWAARLAGDLEENVEQAIACLREAASYISAEAHPRSWAIIQHNLGVAFLQRVKGDGEENRGLAARACHAALGAPHASLTRLLIAQIYVTLATAESDSPAMRLHLEQALSLVDPVQTPLIWGTAHAALGQYRLFHLPQPTVQDMLEGCQHLRSAQSVLTPTNAPLLWAQTQLDLARAILQLSPQVTLSDAAQVAGIAMAAADQFDAAGDVRSAAEAWSLAGLAYAQGGAWETAAELWRKAAQRAGTLSGRFNALDARRRYRATVGDLYGNIAFALLQQGNRAPVPEDRTALLQEACLWLDNSQFQIAKELFESRLETTASASTANQRTLHLRRELFAIDQALEALRRSEQLLDEVPCDPEWQHVRLARLARRRAALSGALAAHCAAADASDEAVHCSSTATSFDEIAHAASEAQATLMWLRTTRWGTCVLAVAPSGAIDSEVVADANLATVRRWLWDGLDGAGTGWINTYRRYRNAPPETDEARVAFAEWQDVLDRTMGAVGEVLWRPVDQLLERLTPTACDFREPPLVGLAVGAGLHSLPIQAAWWLKRGADAEPSGRCYASDRHAFFQMQSVRMLRERMSRASSGERRLLAVCNPLGDLPNAEVEVQSVASHFPQHRILGQFTEPPASVAAVQQLLPEATFALFATHGVFDPFIPWERSGLATVENLDGDQLKPALSLGKLFDMDLHQLELAVLSSCESGLSEYNDAAEDQLGLPSVFHLSGAKSVLGTLWCVDDASTRLLMETFFKELLSAGSQLRPAVALWRAMRCLRQHTGTGGLTIESSDRPLQRRSAARRSADLSHPYFWSAFVLFGVP